MLIIIFFFKAKKELKARAAQPGKYPPLSGLGQTQKLQRNSTFSSRQKPNQSQRKRRRSPKPHRTVLLPLLYSHWTDPGFYPWSLFLSRHSGPLPTGPRLLPLAPGMVRYVSIYKTLNLNKMDRSVKVAGCQPFVPKVPFFYQAAFSWQYKIYVTHYSLCLSIAVHWPWLRLSVLQRGHCSSPNDVMSLIESR